VCQPKPGAIATAWRGRICIHVGLAVSVDGKLMVLETGPKNGPQILSLRKYASNYTRVIFYD
jgi:hypothetical protein